VYDIVAVDQRARRDGAFLEKVGFYDPNTQPNTINFKPERCIYWLNVGAQPTHTVRLLMSYEGVLLRRALQFKGKTEEEINAEVAKHAQVVQARYDRQRDLRKKRKEAKIKAEEEAKKAESAE
jgi:small subunit ribosomal protein S16